MLMKMMMMMELMMMKMMKKIPNQMKRKQKKQITVKRVLIQMTIHHGKRKLKEVKYGGSRRIDQAQRQKDQFPERGKTPDLNLVIGADPDLREEEDIILGQDPDHQIKEGQEEDQELHREKEDNLTQE